MRKIKISDVTLKRLGGEREVSLLFRDKTAIAHSADIIGVDTIELPEIKNVREDTIIYKTIAKSVKGAKIAIPVGATVEGVELAWEAIKDAKSPVLQVELPVSTVQMEYIYHLKADKMQDLAKSLIKKAKELCPDVEFSLLDATRADEDFLISIIKEAEKSGATAITISDDAGVSLPEEIALLVKKIKAEISVPLFVSVSDGINMAVSSAISAIGAGADGLKSAMAGKGVLSTGEISDALQKVGERIGATVSLDNTKIHRTIDEMLVDIRHTTSDEGAVVSEDKKILLDAESTISQVKSASMVLGYELSDEDCGNVHKALLQVCEKKESVGSKELEALIASFAMQAPSTYHLESYNTTSSNVSPSMSQVTLRKRDDILSGVSTGDGPIDSAFRAIEQSVGYHYELDDFQVQAVTEGKEALGSALVRLRNNGKLYSGNGISTDIVAASIRAYINALNKIVFEEE